MRGRVPLARACAPRPADVAQGDAYRNGVLEAVTDRAVRAHVQRLVLGPDELLDRRVRPNQLRERLLREGVQLFQASDRHMLEAGALLVGRDVVVQLPGAQDEAAYVLVLNALECSGPLPS